MKKQRWEESEKRREEKKKPDQRRERKSQKKKDAGARKNRKAANHGVFPMICGSGGSKSRLAKAAGAEPSDRIKHEKLHAVMARSTFRSQNVQNTSASEHFWKLRCWKSARFVARSTLPRSKVSKNWRVRCILEGRAIFWGNVHRFFLRIFPCSGGRKVWGRKEGRKEGREGGREEGRKAGREGGRKEGRKKETGKERKKERKNTGKRKKERNREGKKETGKERKKERKERKKDPE